MGMYWNISEVLSHNKNFNLINGKRSIGKSYTSLKFAIKKGITQNIEFVYIVRTQAEKKDEKALEKAVEKVIAQEFQDYEFECTSDTLYLIEMVNGEKVKRVIAHCIALSEAVKIKKRSFPYVKYIIFDEYMLEASHNKMYVGGWSEPDLLLSIYHTIDREEDKVVVIMLGNTTSFYNPYHLHPAFNIKPVNMGEIYKNDNVLYQWAVSTEELENKKSESKFIKMINKSDYGSYASIGNYIDDNDNFISQREVKSNHIFNIVYNKEKFGIWTNSATKQVYISKKFDPSCKHNYSFKVSDHDETTTMVRKSSHTIVWLMKHFKTGTLYYENEVIKKKLEALILSLV